MKNFIMICLLLIFPAILFANGSPINSSEIYSTGNIEMVVKKNISLEEEFIFVEFEGDYAIVHIKYKFWNHGQKETVTYGFPIDVFAGFFAMHGKPKDNFIVYFEIKDENGQLPVIQPHLSNAFDGIKYNESIRAWYVTDILFEAQKSKTVEVNYKIKCHLDDWVYTKSFRPLFSNRTFTYTLKPSKNWGNGIVKNFVVKLDLRKLLGEDGIIKEIHPHGFKNQDGILAWEATNFNLKEAADIKLIYDNSAAALSRYIAEKRIPVQYLKYSASSVLKTDAINKYNYNPETLFDNDLSTAWVEGVFGNGEGEWVEIEFMENVRNVVGIGIINGYTKREAIYNANSRIKKIQLEVYGGERSMQPYKRTIIELKQKQFNELNKNVGAPFIDWLADIGNLPYGRTNKIKLTILEVYPGTKYEDTCISELYLLGWYR